jgi:hypothetical protein
VIGRSIQLTSSSTLSCTGARFKKAAAHWSSTHAQFRGGNEGKKRSFFEGGGEEQWPAKDATFIAATLYVSLDRPTLFTAPYCTTKYMVLGLLANCTCLRKNLIVFFRLYFFYGQVT